MRNVFLTSAAVMAVLSGHAYAQDGGADNSNAAQTTQVGISDIVVTASRRAENVQKAALSIQAISSEALQRANVTKPEDLSNLAPGVAIGTAGALAQVYIRGVGNYSTQVYSESAVAWHLDGVYISRGWATRGMFYDLERVEVLKGPQGTLYGRNASGGAINVISAKPKLGKLGGFGEVHVGNYETAQGTVAVNVPIGDTVAIRASGNVSRHDGYLSDGYDDDRTRAARLQLLWQPNSDVSLLVQGNYQHLGGKAGGAVFSPKFGGDKFHGYSDPAIAAIFAAQPGLGMFLTFPRNDGFLDIDVYTIGAELNWNFGFANLTILPAYRDSKLRDKHYMPGFSVENYEHNKQTSVEVRLSNDGDRLKWVLGGYFFDETTNNLPGKSALYVDQGFNINDQQDLDLNTRSYAAFGQATYSVTDQFRVTGGLRYTHERKRDKEIFITVPFGAPHVYPLNQRATYNNVSFKAGVEYDVAPRSMVYANISTGFKSGGFYSSPPPNTFKAEKLTSYEVGIKNRFLDNRLQVNLEAFYWDYKDHQESYTGPSSDPATLTFLTVNAGKAKSYGADVDIVFQATPNDELTFKGQYNGSKYDDFQFEYLSALFGPPVTGCSVGAPLPSGNQVVNCAGKSLVRAPKWSGTAGYAHTFDMGTAGNVRAGFDVQFASSAYLSTDFVETAKQKSYAIGNFDLTYTTSDDRFSLTAYVHNIWNSEVKNQAFKSPFVSPPPANALAGPDGVVLATVRPPRTIGARARFNF